MFRSREQRGQQWPIIIQSSPAVAALERNTVEARRALYGRAREALAKQVSDKSMLQREGIALEDAIKMVEASAVAAAPIGKDKSKSGGFHASVSGTRAVRYALSALVVGCAAAFSYYVVGRQPAVPQSPAALTRSGNDKTAQVPAVQQPAPATAIPVVGHDSQASADELIKQANQFLEQHHTDEAVASVKAAIAASPTYHRPWRALDQITERVSNSDDALKYWDDLKTLYSSNPFYLTYHALILNARGKLETAAYGAEIQKAKSILPTDPFILFYSMQALAEMGQYDEALQDVKAYRLTGGNEQVNSAVSFYECLASGINRQFHGVGMPESSWNAPANYEIDITISGVTKPTGIQPWLIQLCRSNLENMAFILGGDADTGFQPKRWKFAGSKEDPFPYRPGLFIWDGSVIAVPKYGTFIVNGTHLKYVQIKDGVTATRFGRVEDWKFVFGD